MNTKDLIKKARQNDEQAISALMSLVGPKAKYIALSYTKKDAMKADDIVQDSFIRAFSHLDQLNDPERFEPWFLKIVNNIAINKTHVKLIDQNSLDFTDLDYKDSTFVDTRAEDEMIPFNPKKRFDYEELKKGMQELLDDLPVVQRQAVYMYYFENLNAREIAEIFKTTEDTVRSRIRYAKNKMKEKIDSLEAKGRSFFVLLLQGFSRDIINRNLNKRSNKGEPIVWVHYSIVFKRKQWIFLSYEGEGE